MTTIQKVFAREILDSRGNPTLEVVCTLASGVTAVASVPSGASTGIHEALELRDRDMSRYAGLGVRTAVTNVNTIINTLVSGSTYTQESLDTALCACDGTANKSKLGANAILGVSCAFAKAVAQEMKVPLYAYFQTISQTKAISLPQPMLNIINGGKHADSGLDIQEFMLGPVGFPTFHEKIEAGAKVIHVLKKSLIEKGYVVSLGDEGGFAPALGSNEEALDLICKAITDAGYTFDQMKIGVDVAASSFYEDGVYALRINGQSQKVDASAMIAWYQKLVATYPIMSIEDGLAEDDWDGFVALSGALGSTTVIVGDDLTVTNTQRIQTAIDTKAINSVLIKLNQIGSVTETIRAIQMTQSQGWAPFISHRSGETSDTLIADLAVGLGCPYIKAGSLARGERVCKYNRLMEIEETL